VQLITAVMETGDIPLIADAALNERDYGALTGLDKSEAGQRYGDAQVRQWRRSYAVAPPDGESLRDTAARVLPYYVRTILPAAMAGGTTLVVSHGNTLRALAMALDGLDASEIERFDLLSGATILYGLGSTTAILERSILN
jgi:2,3-bisphosphoglycerate-dependent phosphoglycerate mutase